MQSLHGQGRAPEAYVAGLAGGAVGSQHGYSIMAQCVLVVMLAGLILAGALGWRYQRVHANETWLKGYRAQYEWHCEALRVFQPAYHALQQKVAALIGPAWVSDFYSIHLAGPLDDRSLKNIDRFKSLVRMALHSDAATDQTLAAIARLRELRSLTLVGRQFTFKGLLELRKLPKLRELELGSLVLTKAELAVLETAVPQASIKYTQEAASRVYERQAEGRRRPGGKPAERPQVGLAPLSGHVPIDSVSSLWRSEM